MGDTAREVKGQLQRHADALEKVASDFPGLVSLIKGLGDLLNNYATQKRIKTSDVKFGEVKWTREGLVIFKVENNSKVVLLKGEKEWLKKEGLTLEKVGTEFPELIRLTMSLGHQLVNYSLRNRLETKKISFGPAHWTKDDEIVFKALYDKRILTPKEVIL